MGLSQDGQALMLGLTRDVYQNMELARGRSKSVLKMAELEMIFLQPPPLPSEEYEEENIRAQCIAKRAIRSTMLESKLPLLRKKLAQAEVIYFAALNRLAHLTEQKPRPATTVVRPMFISVGKYRLHQRIKNHETFALQKLRFEIAASEGELKELGINNAAGTDT